jgi:hypothetical protein
LNILNSARRGLLALTAVVALGAAQLAFATTITLHTTGFANGFSESFDFTGEPFSPVSTGGFTGTINLDPTPITFFCFDLGHFFSPGNSYQYDDSIQTGGKFDELSRLFTEGFSTSTTTADFSAGFQLAVWEILMQTTPDDLNSPDGSFYVTNDHGNTGAVTRANTLLAGLSSSSPDFTIHLLHSLDTDPQHQDFVYGELPPTLRKVPEPGPLSLIAVALIALIAVRRRVDAKPAV